MEVFKIIFMHFLIIVFFTAHGCKSQHWSHGWLPGGKRNAVSMDAYVQLTDQDLPYKRFLQMINDEDIVGEIEVPRFQYLYEKVKSPQAFTPDINDRNLQKKRKVQSNFQENID